MASKPSTDPYKGVRDFYPKDWERINGIFSTIRSTLAKWGYEEYNASPLERSDIYEAKTSEEIVNEQTYTFLDRGDRRVTIRPEMTPTLARMVAAKRRELPFPLRWFSIPNLFRYERPQRGRLREHYQANVDLIGLPSGEADIEIIIIASEILKAFGAKESDFIVRINSRPLLNAACAAAGLSGGAIARYVRLLDRKAKMSADEFKTAVSVFTNKDPLNFIEQSSSDPDVAREKKHLLDTLETLKRRGVGNVVFDPLITRGFDYYTGIVFEVFDTSTENPRSIFGGGRYDELVSLFGASPAPAVGFGMGDITLSDFLYTHSLNVPSTGSAPQLYLGTPTPEDRVGAQIFAKELREKGGRVFVNLTEKSLGDQIKDAVKRSIPLFLAYGSEEKKSDTVRMKILATGEESALAKTELPARMRAGS